MPVNERAFEDEICAYLRDKAGYVAVKSGNAGVPEFDVSRGIDTAELFAFLGATQADAWAKLQMLHGGDPDVAQRAFLDRLAKELDARGTVDVLRHGVVDLGVTIKLAWFRPAHGLTPELVRRYQANRLTVTRQLPYQADSNRTLDLALFVNGIPVATVELKTAQTGQTVEDAKRQYRTDRDAANVTLARRAVVHFAVDTEQVAMTTRLEGVTTRFLPFNRGMATGDRTGNPRNPAGHRVAYLWEQVWQRDAWLDLLNRFVHVEKPSLGSKAAAMVIFPCFHQWDAVLRLERAAREEGAGHDYLIEHSAGSGKSNTIAWLAHRLSTLHGADDQPVFDKVVVITDRRVLDKQLQDTIYQFEHAHGVVEPIETDSNQLGEALIGEQARIIIATLQKFPVVSAKGIDLPDRRYAVIVDEAHSSQTGDAATDLKKVLGAGPGGDDENGGNVAEDLLAQAATARGQQQNLSFFAFTATPKGRTLELFGRIDQATGKHQPFHLYSMRQAIAEGFILDTLANYLTYTMFFHLEKAIRDDPAYDTSKAKAAIASFVSLHEQNLAAKAKVIVEHFERHVRHRIGGRAKAMVVTASRKQAAGYQRALTKYIRENGYDLGVLVAFSGSITDGDETFTESNMNPVPDTQTVPEFASERQQILIVAEKYQTGFDQPLLCAMYVDKVLSNVSAVQTLSRLNRIHPAKRQDDLFVLDFRNDADDIRKAFQPWYGETVAPPTDPNLLYDTRRGLDEFGVLRTDEATTVAHLILGSGAVGDSGRASAALQPAVDRFAALANEEQDRFRDCLMRFVRTYSFLSQIVSFTDVGLERDYIYAKSLSALLRPLGAAGYDLGAEVELTHLRLELVGDGSIYIPDDDGEVATIFSGVGRSFDAEEERLSRIIAMINERFGTEFDPSDRLFYDAVAAKLAQREDMQQAAAANTPENFKLVLEKEFTGGVLDQMAASEDMAVKYLNNSDLQQMVLAAYLPLVQNKSKVAWQENCPISDLLGPDLESVTLEYKSTLRTRAGTGEVFKPLETASLKTVAAFLNSEYGGTLLLGIADDGTIFGLDQDYASLHKTGKDDRDLFQLHLGNIVSQSMGAAAAALVTPHLHTVDGRDVCRVHIRPSGVPVEATVVLDQKGQLVKDEGFFIRVGNGTKKLDLVQREKYIASRWPS